MPNIYDIGDEVKMFSTFRTGATPPVAADPTTITLRIKRPNGITTKHVFGVDVGVIKEDVGIYTYKLIVQSSGDYYYRWEGTGALTAAGETSFTVRDSEFYTT